ncbi:MAG: hypothetical protein EXR51_04940 [Dehalococcoidia bacterium]|nr:hypothetical protein [Dehalococcoidia bacterium]
MATRETRRTDINEISGISELLRLAEEVCATRQPRVLTRDGEELVVVEPAEPPSRKHVKGGVITKDDALWQLVGSANDAEPTDASQKYEYLAQQYP